MRWRGKILQRFPLLPNNGSSQHFFNTIEPNAGFADKHWSVLRSGGIDMILQSLAGLPAFLVYLCTATVVVMLYLLVYTRITAHNEFQLIRDNIPGAAIALGLSLLGFVLPVVSAMTHASNVIDCLIWSIIA
ncbi:MAG: DUF350 domain-containing protein, partial [Solirubrobacteraceae bacterium]|nr:DUF350 domain-containing protein [Solirubrobacteraceae bacterium]